MPQIAGPGRILVSHARHVHGISGFRFLRLPQAQVGIARLKGRFVLESGRQFTQEDTPGT